MKIRTFSFILLTITLLFLSCNGDKPTALKEFKDTTQHEIKTNLKKELSPKSAIDSIVLKETFNKEDEVNNEYLTKQLKPIRANFKRINSISKWTSTEVKDIWQTTEGGHATLYYNNKKLEKIVARYYGEMYQMLREYYLLNGKLSFVFQKLYRYNRPMYYDSLEAKANNDDEAFDFDKSKIEETRSYFEKEKLIHQVSNQDCGTPFTKEYLLGEEELLKDDFESTLKPEKN